MRAAAVAQFILLDERPDLAGLALGHLPQLLEVDLDVEVAGVGEQRAILHPFEMLGPQYPPGPRNRDEDVSARSGLERRHHLVAGHSRLERPERLDLADDHHRAGAAGAFGDALASPAVADHHDRVPGEQHVGGADDPVERRLAGAVAVVERPLGTSLVDRQHRAPQPGLFLETAQPQQPGRRLLGASDERVQG